MPDDPDAELMHNGLAAHGGLSHVSLFWNPSTLEWYCRDCGRTSDHQDIRDARTEIALFPCLPPGS